MKFEIKWKGGRIITEAPDIEEAIKKFKELRIEVTEKEISIASFYLNKIRPLKGMQAEKPISLSINGINVCGLS